MYRLTLSDYPRNSGQWLQQSCAEQSWQFWVTDQQQVLSHHVPAGLDKQPIAQNVAKGDDRFAQIRIMAPSLNMDSLMAFHQALSAHVQTGGVSVHAGPAPGMGISARLSLAESPPATLNQLLETLAQQFQLELSLISHPPVLSKPGLLLMDMDSTVIQAECIDEIAYLAGVGDKVAGVTAQAMRGELDFAQSLRERVACLKGADAAILQQVKLALPLMPGVTELIRVLKQHDWRVAIASGGFTFFAEYLQQRLELDAVFANELVIEQGRLSGEVKGRIVDATFKAESLSRLAQQWDINMAQTVAMGDGANDLPMLRQAALGIACHAKPVVRQQAEANIRFGSLDTILHLLDP